MVMRGTEGIYDLAWLGNDGIYKFKTIPRRHQVECLIHEWRRPAWGRFHQMRTGKTPLTVYEMDALAQFGLASRFLVVCPKRVIDVWKGMLPHHSHTPWRIVTNINDLKHYNPAVPTVLLTNYE